MCCRKQKRGKAKLKRLGAGNVEVSGAGRVYVEDSILIAVIYQVPAAAFYEILGNNKAGK
jgi:beta-lactamase class D